MDNKQKTTADEMASMHHELVCWMRNALKQDDVPMGLVKEVREFLKDNNIQASPQTANEMARDFLDQLPTYED